MGRVDCFKSKDKFFKRTSEFFNRINLVEFLLKIVLNVEESSGWYCDCDGSGLCVYCVCRESFYNDQYEIYKNSHDMDFLEKCHRELMMHLMFLLKNDGHFVCHLINRGFKYMFEDWCDGNYMAFTIIEIVRKHKKHKNIEIKNDNCTIILNNDLKNFGFGF